MCLVDDTRLLEQVLFYLSALYHTFLVEVDVNILAESTRIVIPDRLGITKGWKLSRKVTKPEYDKTNKMTCMPSEDSDQPGHPPSLIRVFAVGFTGRWRPRPSSGWQRRLWSDSDHVILLVLLCSSSDNEYTSVPLFLHYATHYNAVLVITRSGLGSQMVIFQYFFIKLSLYNTVHL